MSGARKVTAGEKRPLQREMAEEEQPARAYKTRRGGKSHKRWLAAYHSWLEQEQASDEEAERQTTEARRSKAYPQETWTNTELRKQWEDGSIAIPPKGIELIDLVSDEIAANIRSAEQSLATAAASSASSSMSKS